MPIWYPLNKLEEVSKNLNKKNDYLISPVAITCVTESEKAKMLVKRHIAYYIGGMGDFYYNFLKRIGFQEDVDKVNVLWKSNQRDLAAQKVTDEMVNKIGIIGTPEEIEKRFQSLEKQGIAIPTLMLPFNCPIDLAIQTIEAFSE